MYASESCLEHSPSNIQPAAAYYRLFGTVSRLYCRLFHKSISRPVNGKYQCWKCLQQFEIQW
jgi:hypothetical protein